MAFWDDQIPSLVDPKKKFPRKDYLGLIDYHSTHANQQSAQTLQVVNGLIKLVEAQNRELTLLREDVNALAQAVVNRTTGGA